LIRNHGSRCRRYQTNPDFGMARRRSTQPLRDATRRITDLPMAATKTP
jgi:hypothetical protein